MLHSSITQNGRLEKIPYLSILDILFYYYIILLFR